MNTLVKIGSVAFTTLLATSLTIAQGEVNRIVTAFSEAQPGSLDVHAASNADQFLVLRNVCEGLITYDPITLEPVPSLAETWDISDDGLTYTFYLRSGVTFHDGSPLDANDVKYSLDRLANRETGTSYTAGLILSNVVGWSEARPPAPTVGEGTPTPEPITPAESISGVSVVDENTVSITLRTVAPAFLSRLTLPGGFIVPEGAGEAADFAQNPLCSGPYSISENIPDQQIVLSAYDGYWNGAPQVDEVVIRVIPEQSVQILEFEAGSLDIVSVPPSDLARIRADGTLASQLIEIPTLSVFTLRINLNDPVLGDVRVRQALSQSIDRQLIIDTVLQGQGVPANGLYPPGLSTFDPSFIPAPYDPEAAAALLAEAGYPDGLDIELRTGQIETEVRVLNAIAQTATASGFNIIINSTERSVWDQDRTACNMQAGSVAWGLDYPDPENVAQIAIGGTSAARLNCGYGEYELLPEAQALYDQGVTTALGEERDLVFREFQNVVIAEAVATIPIYHGTTATLINARLGGTPVDNQGIRQFALISLGE